MKLPCFLFRCFKLPDLLRGACHSAVCLLEVSFRDSRPAICVGVGLTKCK